MAEYKLRYKLLFSFVGVITFFILAEMSLRVLDFHFPPKQRYKFDPSFFIDPQVSEGLLLKDPVRFWKLNPRCPFAKELGINSKGFRDREFDVKKGKGVYRVVCLGDSVTYGCPEDRVRMEETYPKRLEAFLNSSFPKRKFEVINAGVPGYSSYQGLMYLKELLSYKPDLVTIHFGPDDGATAVYYSDKEQHSLPLWIIKLQNWLINFRLYQLLCKIIISPKKAGNFSDDVYRKPRVSYEEHIDNINEMIKIDHQHNIKIIYITPLLYENGRIIPIYPINNLNIPKVDLVRRLQEFEGDLEDLFVDDCHLTPKGHQIAAEEIYSTLINERIVKEK